MTDSPSTGTQSSPRAANDQIRYCDRCGISFLWSAEEQAQHGTNAAPTHCAGCRTLLPENGRVRGLVKWYNVRKRFGFIVRHDQPELFVHGSALEGGGRLSPGDLVEFSIGESERGPAAQAVRVLVPKAMPAIEG